MFLWGEGVAVVAWWIWLVLDPRAMRYFLPRSFPDHVLHAIAIGDLLLYGVLAIVAAIGWQRRQPWAFTALCLHTGAVMYAGLFGWGMVVATGEAWLGACLMTVPMVILPCYIRILGSERAP